MVDFITQDRFNKILNIAPLFNRKNIFEYINYLVLKSKLKILIKIFGLNT